MIMILKPAMADIDIAQYFKHLVVAKFKEGVNVVEDILSGMEKLVSEIDSVVSFQWGEDIESLEMLRQGYTHAFMMTFKSKDEFNSFLAHPKHVEFSATFSQVIDKIVVLDFPVVQSKSISSSPSSSAPAAPTAATAPASA